MEIHRRDVLTTLSGAFVALMAGANRTIAKDSLPPSRIITHEAGFFWFGYYDKLQFSPDNRYVLSNRVRFEHRSPTANDEIEVGMIDLADGDRWIPLGKSVAWNWQQGCMLQWIPGTESSIIWNDREGDRFVSHILDVVTKEKRTIGSPIYALCPDGKTAVSCDFTRVADCRPGYGYAGFRDPHFDNMAPKETGITRVDLDTGKAELILSHHQLATTGEIINPTLDAKHHAYHLLVSPAGNRFILLHRWAYPKGNHLTRLITANLDGSDLRIVIPNGYASHFIWRDADHILSQAKGWLGNENWGNFLFQDKDSGVVEEVGKGVLDSGGHITYVRKNEWILNDTYPKGKERFQTPHLYHIASNRRINLGDYHSPSQYVGEWRVDNHPRVSRDERYVCIDAPAGERGRQLHLIDISEVM